MAVAKIYNENTGQWEAAITGATGPTGPTGAAGSDGALSHNYIINGAFDIWQRGEDSGSTSLNNTFTADRWKQIASGGTYQVTKVDFTEGELSVPGFGEPESYLKLDVTSGNDNLGIQQLIEDGRTLAGQDATLSFWAKGTNPGGGTLLVDARQFFDSSTPGVFEQSISLTASWQRFEFSFSVPSASGETVGANSYLRVQIRQPPSDNSTDPWELNLWGVQLEAGSIATPFKRNANSIAGELESCKYYYRRLQGMIANLMVRGATTTYSTINFGDMRSSPTITPSDVAGFSLVIAADATRTSTDFATAVVNNQSARLTIDSTGMTAGHAGYVSTKSGEFIELNSEL